MTVDELSEKYDKELSGTIGDKELRYYLLSPLFQNLYQNKIVYHERFTAFVQLSNISLTPDMFTARAELISTIRTLRTQRSPLPKHGKFLQIGHTSPYTKDAFRPTHPGSSGQTRNWQKKLKNSSIPTISMKPGI